MEESGTKTHPFMLCLYQFKCQCTFKGAGLCNIETNFVQNDNFAVFLIGHMAEIFQILVSQNESVILKVDSCTS